MAKNEKKAPASVGSDRIRKLGDCCETIRHPLSQEEVDEEKGRVCDLLARRDNITASLKSIKAEYKAKLDVVDERIGVARRAASDRFRDLDLDVEEWLTRGNEVVRVRSDTGEVLGRRTASADELQESMFTDDPPRKASADPDGFPTADEAFGHAIS